MCIKLKQSIYNKFVAVTMDTCEQSMIVEGIKLANRRDDAMKVFVFLLLLVCAFHVCLLGLRLIFHVDSSWRITLPGMT